MKYQIIIRKLEVQDLGSDCHFPNADKENYIIHLNALLEDIKSIGTIDVVNEVKGIISIESQLSDKNEFWGSVSFLFEREKEHIKFVSCKQIT